MKRYPAQLLDDVAQLEQHFSILPEAAVAGKSGVGLASAAQQAGMWEELNGDLVVYDLLENGLRVKVTPKGECFYGTLVQGADSARWTSLDGKETRSFAVSTPVRSRSSAISRMNGTWTSCWRCWPKSSRRSRC